MDKEKLTEDDLIRLISEEPRYFKRPFVTVNGRTIFGTNAKKLAAELG